MKTKSTFCTHSIVALLPALLFSIVVHCDAKAQPLPIVEKVDFQPLVAQVERVVQALEHLGAPLNAMQRADLDNALANENQSEAIKQIQSLLDPLCLVGVHISPESRVKAQPGAAPKKLMQHGWRVFLVKIQNKAGVTATLRCTSPNAEEMHDRDNSAEPPQTITPQDVVGRWLDVSMYDKQPLEKRLSGLAVEYRLIELYSRDVGKREAKLQFDVGQGTQDLGFRNEVNLLFDCEPSVDVKLAVLDDDGTPTTAQFVFRDARGRIYPARARRIEPDFFFHDQIYRRHGESVKLPPGKYQVEYSRGPEYRHLEREIEVPPGETHRERFQLERWIKLADKGWYSGDHHVHAAGCAHYSSPTQGVGQDAMMRHILGEDLNVGCVLTWGPCWYKQKENFKGDISDLSTDKNVMRYDVEVSGFPSSHAGHLCLLRLTEDDYPGTTRIEEWPSWDLPVLKWGMEQGGVVGFSHSGWGLEVPATSLPTFDMPKYDGIGANEYIVDVTHGVCDFISAVDTPFIWEMNVWYHTLNCGFTCRISGETDFPCIYGERIGLGRAYVKLPKNKPINYDQWAYGIRDGRSYCSDGHTHLYNFQINDLGVGEIVEDEADETAKPSLLRVESGQPLDIKVTTACLLDEKPRDDIRSQPLKNKPYWHPERARVGDSRQVPVELIVNGHAVDQQLIDADGSIQDVAFQYTPERSSWVAIRVFAAAHTNPIFVEVDGQPIRASKSSAQWCIDSVDRCWESKQPQIREEEREAALAAYDHARKTYQQILAESYDDR